MSVLKPFPLLLNDLSNELHEMNLHSLIHVCEDLIPAGQRENIRSGWEAFSILRQLNVIGREPEKMANLLVIIKALRPRRRDLVTKIKRHIQDNYKNPDLILKDFESSSDFTLPFRDRLISRPSTPIISHIIQEDCCRIRCCGLACICNPCCDACCCCVILALLFFFLAIIAALAWYSNIPVVSKYLNSDDGTTTAGPFVISILGFLAVCSVISVIYIRYCRPDQLNYAMLPSSQEIRSNQAGYASSESVHTSYNSAMGRGIERPRRECSCSSGQFTASSSLTSRASLRCPRLSDDVVPDCSPQDDYTDVLTQEVEEVAVEGDLTDV